jgi:hypothetical protein
MGTFSINNTPVKILFDSGATHSFISENLLDKLGLKGMQTKSAYKITGPGRNITSHLVTFGVPLRLGSKVIVTPGFKGKTECIDHVCARIKLHTRLDIMNTKTSATQIKSYYKP